MEDYVNSVPVLHETIIVFGKGCLPGKSPIHPVEYPVAGTQCNGNEISVGKCTAWSQIDDIAAFPSG